MSITAEVDEILVEEVGDFISESVGAIALTMVMGVSSAVVLDALSNTFAIKALIRSKFPDFGMSTLPS